jgi:hypothetical protein
MDEETITLTGRDLRRLRTIESALAGRITNSEGAQQLSLSERQFIRLRGRVAKEGPSGVIHKGRGRVSNRRLGEEERERIKELLKDSFEGFNDTHAHELLTERHGVTCCRQTLRSLRIEAGLGPKRKRRPPRHRSRRERRERAGAMLLLDGSTHAWFEERGPRCTLLGAIDDASGEVVALRFEPVEDLAGYLALFETVFTARGVPASTYTDRHGVFFVNRPQQSIEEQLEGEEPLSQLGRALDEVGIARIYSLSPQARGRVERLWGTLQDRLVSEFRLEGICRIEEANRFLPSFLARFNARFAIPAASSDHDWLAAPRDLDWFLCAKYRRTVGNDNTVRFGERTVDIPPDPMRATFARAKVEVHELRDGTLRIVHEGRVIATQDAPPGFERLRPRGRKGLTEAGYLPVVVLPSRTREEASSNPGSIRATG